MTYEYESLDTITDINGCISSYINNPTAMTNCIREKMGYPSVSPGTLPIVDNNTVVCLRSIFDQFKGSMDTSGNMRMPFQTMLKMINDVNACLNLPAINIPPIVNCIYSCNPLLAPDQPIDLTCMGNCISQNY